MKKKLDIKRLILLNLPYVFSFYFVNKLATVFRLAPGDDLLGKLRPRIRQSLAQLQSG
mgnify:CR=1 FL=1